MSANAAALLYLVSGVLFILALRGLSSPESSRLGNLFGMVGMAIAIVTTLALLQSADSFFTWFLIIAGIGIGDGLEFAGVLEAVVVDRQVVFGHQLGEPLAERHHILIYAAFRVLDRILMKRQRNAAKVRKDLSYLGSYGTRGVGYDVEFLVYLAEHYVIDVLAGWAVVGASFWIWARLERWWAARAGQTNTATATTAEPSNVDDLELVS